MRLCNIGIHSALLVTALCVISGCNATGSSPPTGAADSLVQRNAAFGNATLPADNTSILKQLKKDVIIGTTTDPTDGDIGPHALSVVQIDDVLKKGQLLVCNFETKSGKAGAGTTIDLFNPTPGSKPVTFAQNNAIEGCAGDAPSTVDYVYGAGLSSGVIAEFNQKGKLIKTYGSPFKEPFSDVNVSCPTGSELSCLYSAAYIFGSDAETGSIISFAINEFGNPHEVQVATGFAVNKKSGWSTLGPSGLAYDYPHDTLYIADGVDDTVVAFTHTSNLLITDEIIVEPGGKTFKCKHKTFTCGKLVLAGSPLNAPEAMTLLPNGNLIAANTAGSNANMLVEFTPTGTVLDTEILGKKKTAGIFGLAASGTNDDNTVVFFTDTNSNNLHELER
jgi:hypothetical protein